jgi:starch synthase
VALRVLHIISPFYRRDGVGRAVEELARHQPDIEPHLCTSRMLSPSDAFRSIHELGGPNSLFHFARRREIAETIEHVRPDIVHMHGGIWTPFLAMSPAFRVPLVLSVYDWPRLPPFPAMFRGAWAEMRSSSLPRSQLVLSTFLPRTAVRAALGLRRVRGVLTQDPLLAKKLNGAGRIEVTLTGGGGEVDHLRAHYQRERPVVVFAGRAELARGIDTIIRAMPRVLDSFPQTRLRLLLLPTDQLSTLNRLISESGVARHVEINRSPVQDLREHFAGCTIGVFPFKYDHTTLAPPLTVVEAMSVGLPVIGTPVACLSPVLMDGRNGLIAPIGDPAALARAIREAISNEGKWRALSAGALETVERSWTWARAASVVTELYQEVLRSA